LIGLVGWLTVLLFDLLVGSFVIWLVDRLMICSLFGWLIGWLVGWLVRCLVGLLVGWLVAGQEYYRFQKK
jgi:hypothetical protein